NVPLFTWGMTTSELLTNATKFPTLVSASGTTLSLVFAFIDIMGEFFECGSAKRHIGPEQKSRSRRDLNSDREIPQSAGAVIRVSSANRYTTEPSRSGRKKARTRATLLL